MKDGSWLFLFDSFDEIPEILSSTDATETVGSYAEAISDFLHGLNKCRGIIASREYKGPNLLGWPKFRILPLSENRQQVLVRQFDLSKELEAQIIGNLGVSTQNIRQMSSNPMFLSLLCDYVKSNASFPEHDYTVYEEFIRNRFSRDKERLQRRYRLLPEQVRYAAEIIAFCMMADSELGLSPSREEINESIKRNSFIINESFEQILDALEFLKLARSETITSGSESRPFTFAHRRLQEYFATSVVLREPDRVSSIELLTNGVWRETCVVMLQTQPLAQIQPLVQVANELVGNKLKDYKSEPPQDYLDLPQPFPWPQGLLHILGILQDALASRPEILNSESRRVYTEFLLYLSVTDKWLDFDLMWAINVSGILSQENLSYMLSDAFKHRSSLVRNSAYLQAKHLIDLTKEHEKAIRESLIIMAKNGRLRKETHSIQAHLSRLAGAENFIHSFQFLRTIPLLEGVFVFFSIFLVWLLFARYLRGSFEILLPIFLIIPILIDYSPFLRKWAKWVKIGVGTLAILISSFFGVFYFTEDSSTLLSLQISLSFLLYAYLLAWKYLAYELVKNGVCIKPYQWIFSTIYAPIYIISRYTIKAFKLLYSINKYIIVIMILLAMAISAIMVLIVDAYGTRIKTSAEAMDKAIAPYGVLLLLGALIIIVPLFLYYIVKEERLFSYLLLEPLELRRLTSKPDINAKELMQTVQSYRLKSSRVNYLHHLRTNSQVSISEADLIMLQRLSSQVQFDLTRFFRKSILTKEELKNWKIRDVFDEWYIDCVTERRFFQRGDRAVSYGLAAFGQDFLEELNLLIAQLKLPRV